MRRSVVPIVLSVLVVAISLGILGCEKECATAPQNGMGQIVGRITGGNNPLRADIDATRVEDASGPSTSGPIFHAQTDSTGAYVLEVTPGKYTLLVLVRDIVCCAMGRVAGGMLSMTESDTFLVERPGDSLRVDVPLGAVRLDLTVPPQLNGKNIQGVLHPELGHGYAYAFADVNGDRVDLLFPAVNPGRFRMTINTTTSEVWLPGSYRESEGDWVTVETSKQTLYEASIPERGMIYGTVTGSWQQMNLPRPQVQLFDGDSVMVSRNTTTWQGLYQVWILLPVRVRLLTIVGGTAGWFGGESFADATEFDLRPGDETEVNVVESGIACELGRAGASSCGRAPANLHDDRGRLVATTTIGRESGMIRFAKLRPGIYFLHISQGPTWIEQWFDHAMDLADATPIELTAEGQLVWVTPTLMDGAKITGRVLDSHGASIIGASIELTPSDVDEVLCDRRDLTGTGGQFSMPALLDGTYKLQATTAAGGVIWYPGVAEWDSAGVIAIENLTDVTGLEIRYP